ncbi:MAG: hypothetical protein KDC95_09790 [Planctomycetes bacterium]|nr:hypothetical protein [Planctomycetota bacterium]
MLTTDETYSYRPPRDTAPTFTCRPLRSSEVARVYDCDGLGSASMLAFRMGVVSIEGVETLKRGRDGLLTVAAVDELGLPFDVIRDVGSTVFERSELQEGEAKN